MYTILAGFGLAFFIAGFIIYPRPTLFLAILLFVFTMMVAGSLEDNDNDDES